jgi:hypothetical protein
MGIILIWAIGVVLVMAVAATLVRSYRKSRVPPQSHPNTRQHPPKRRKRPRHNH